jgi:ABC-2 type transport system ATP-binding protein
MADRIGVVNKGELILVRNKTELMRTLGKKQLTLHLQRPMTQIPAALAEWPLALKDGGREIEYRFDSVDEDTGVPALLKRMGDLGIAFHDLNTRQSSLEEIFVSLVSERGGARP